MLRLTARWADAWNTAWFGAPDARFATRMADFDEALAFEERDPASIIRTAGMEVSDEPSEAVVASLAGFAARGIDHVIVRLEPPRTERSLERLGDAVAAYRSAAPTPAAIR